MSLSCLGFHGVCLALGFINLSCLGFSGSDFHGGLFVLLGVKGISCVFGVPLVCCWILPLGFRRFWLIHLCSISLSCLILPARLSCRVSPGNFSMGHLIHHVCWLSSSSRSVLCHAAEC